jgi:DNA-binding SARP family transcriptional activator
MVELRALGSIDLRRDGTEITAVLTQPKRLALLLYLDLARPHGFHRRDRLVSLLWPELDATHSRNALSKAIHHIRRELGETSITTRGDEVMLDPIYIRSDVRVLEAALLNNDHMRAVQLYQGPLADGFFVEDAPEFERWLSDERNQIRISVANAAWALADKSRVEGRIEDATMYARSASGLTRDDEPSVRRLMRFLESVGDRAGALRAYDEFAIWLSDELDANPAADTEALRDSIRNSDTIHLTPVDPMPPVPVPITTATPVTAPGKKRPLWIRYAPLEAAVIALAIILGLTATRSNPDSQPTVAPHAAANPLAAAVAPFENRTGNPAYDSVGVMAMDWISQNVAATGLVSVVDPRAQSTANAGLVVSGSYYTEGDHLRFQAQLASAGTILRVFVPVTAPLDDPTQAFDNVASQATASIAEATDSRVSAFAKVGPHPPSYAAYREYVQGIEAFTIHDEKGSYDHFMRAYEIDTTFVTALLNASASILSKWSGNDSIIAMLQKRRSSLTRFNQLWLDSFLAAQNSDWNDVYRITGELARQAPGSYFPYIHAGAAIGINRPRAARDALLRIDPTQGWMRNYVDYWYTRCAAQHMLGDYDAELADSEIGARQYPGSFVVISCRLRALAARGRSAEIDSVSDAAAGIAQHETWDLGSPYSITAAEADWHGYPEIAARARKRTVDWVKSLPPEKLENDPRIFGPTWLLFNAGAWPELRERVRTFRPRHPDDSFWTTFDGIVAAHYGDTVTANFADSVLQVIAKPGGDARYGRMYLPIALFHRAEIAALRGDRDRAITLLTDAFANKLRYVIYTHADPAFLSVRNDPRYKRLMAPRD